MKKYYLFIVAMLFIIGMSFLIADAHVFDERPKKPIFTPKRIERALPRIS